MSCRALSPSTHRFLSNAAVLGMLALAIILWSL